MKNQHRLGRCYELAAERIVVERFSKRVLGSVLVHGVIKDTNLDNLGCVICHAWLIIQDKVWEPVADMMYERDAFERLFDPTEVHRYTADQAVEFMMKTKHYGPWEEMPEEQQKTFGQAISELISRAKV